MTEKDLQIQDLKAENEKLKEELEQLKQPKAAVDTERLTIEYDGHYVPKELCTIDRLGGADDCEPCHENCDKDCGECAVQKCFDKLAEYEDLEEQGLLLKLPCKVGETVFCIYSRWTKCSAYNEEKDEYRCQGCECACDSRKEKYISEQRAYSLDWIITNLKAFGKTVFLTEQEAQAALEKMVVEQLTKQSANPCTRMMKECRRNNNG